MPDGIVRKATWIILDRGQHLATCRGENETPEAEALLRDYLAKNYPEGVPSPHPVAAPKVPRPDDSKIVYFVTARAIAGFPVKIGLSTRDGLRYRLGALQVGCPFDLAPIAAITGNERTEQGWHAEFSQIAMRGEWFRRDPSLIREIRDRTGRDPNPPHPFDPTMVDDDFGRDSVLREVFRPSPVEEAGV